MRPQRRITVIGGLLLALTIAAPKPLASSERQGEVRRIVAGGEAPSCIEDKASARCAVEESLLRDMIPENERGLFVSLVNWILDILLDLLITRNSDNPAPYEARGTVVIPRATEYRILSKQRLDEAAVAEYRSHSKARAYDPRLLRPGMMKMLVELRYWDGGGVFWPQEGWQAVTYYFKPRVRGWRMSFGIKFPRNQRFILEESFEGECIGEPGTPICAVETWLACHMRKTPALCRLVTNETTNGLREVPYLGNGRALMFDVLRINPSDMEFDSSAGSPRNYEVILSNSFGPIRQEGMPRSEEYLRFVLSRAPTGWQIAELEITHWVRPD